MSSFHIKKINFVVKSTELPEKNISAFIWYFQFFLISLYTENI